MWGKLQKITQKRLGLRPENKYSTKNDAKFVTLHFMLVSVKLHVKPLSISENISILAMIHLPIIPMESS